MKRKFYSVLYIAVFALLMSGCSMSGIADGSRSAVKGNVAVDEETTAFEQDTSVAVEESTEAERAYCEVDGNVPGFSEDELVTEAFENYSDLDFLGRCGVAYANICKELMPTEERGEIGMVKPSGWHTVKYSDRIDGNYLYNRCHLIGYQLAGENANEKNLITGTRYLNVTGMLPFENEVADYVESTGNHVLYRVTPVFDGDNLVASGVQMEAESVEDKGAGVCFNVYVYNVQPGVIIDYATGDSEADPGYGVPDGNSDTANEDTYIVNTNTGKFHKPSCRSVKQMKESNKSERTTTRDELISEGYEPCKNCNP